MWTCVKWEWRRQFRQARFWGSLAALAVLGVLFAYGYGQMRGQADIQAILGRAVGNGFFVPILALILCTGVILPFFASVAGADLVSGERQLGTWNILLTQGISPWRLYLGKWWFGVGYSVLAVLVLAVSSLASGIAWFGIHAAAIPSGVVVGPMGFVDIVALMVGYAAAGQIVVVTMSLLVSAFSRLTVSAIVVAVGILVFLSMLGDIPFLAATQRFFFTSYFSRVGDVLGYPVDWMPLVRGLEVYALYMVMFWAAILWFQPFRD